MYNGDPNLFVVYECGGTKTEGQIVVVKQPFCRGFSPEHDGATVYLEGGGHFNCYWMSKENAKATEFFKGDVLEVVGHYKVYYYSNAILRRLNSPTPTCHTLTDWLLTEEGTHE